jgi:hypothetical protein
MLIIVQPGDPDGQRRRPASRVLGGQTTMADQASTIGQVVTECAAAGPPPPAALACKRDEDVQAQVVVVAETLTAHGFDVRGPDWEDSRLLKVMGLRDVTCEITVEDSGLVTWEYFPRAADGTDPDKIASRVQCLLTGTGAELPPWRRPRAAPAAGLKGLVGGRLKAMGMAVCLDVYEDHDTYEVVAEIIVTNPARPERGQVRVSDDGALMWECGYEEDPSDAAAIAGVIVTVLARDLADGCIPSAELAIAGATGRATGPVSLVGG